MPEQFPSDQSLYFLEEDFGTGVPYIPQGLSPYHLAFRQMQSRLILSSERANDLRVYQSGDLTIGIRGGQTFINNQSITITPEDTIAIPDNQITSIWISQTGSINQAATGFPLARSTYIPLADIQTSEGKIISLIDRRGEGFLYTPNLASLGIAATEDEINQALVGTNSTVTSESLNRITGGYTSLADNDHRHQLNLHDQDGLTHYTIMNPNTGSNADVALILSLPNIMAGNLSIHQNTDNGFATQNYNGVTYQMLGVSNLQTNIPGTVTTNVPETILGLSPSDGQITSVNLSVKNNIVSTNTNDSISMNIFVNGQSIMTTQAELTSAAGTGFKSTAQNDGTVGIITASGPQIVKRGDLISYQFTHSAAGTVSQDFEDIGVLIIINNDGPE